jgi:phage/plasmid-associated DNA primase
VIDDKPRLRSVDAFNRVEIPHTLDDVYEKGMDTSLKDNFDWLETRVVNRSKDGMKGDIKYKISSVSKFARWLIKFDDYVVKNDWGYKWNGNYWDRIKVKDVQNMIDVSIVAIADELKLATNKKRELQKDVKTYLLEVSQTFDDSVKPDYIAFKEWTLDVTTNIFSKPDKDKNIIGGFNFLPVPNETPETWVAYSKYMFGENSDFFWAWLGYAFQNDMSWRQGALFLLDPIGGTGKTHFITKITQAMFGEKRVGAFKLESLQGNEAKFQTARFVDKSLMIDDDATKVRFNRDDVFKAVTGGGLTPIEHKGIDGSEYLITAKMIINVNEMPIFNNAGAIKRRLHILKTQAPFASFEEIKKRNKLFPEDKLNEEKSMLATYAIEMFQKAVREDWHIKNDIVDDIVATDPFVLWFSEHEKGTFKFNELYKDFNAYFEDLSLGEESAPMSKNAFGRKMTNYATKVNKMDGKYYQIK